MQQKRAWRLGWRRDHIPPAIGPVIRWPCCGARIARMVRRKRQGRRPSPTNPNYIQSRWSLSNRTRHRTRQRRSRQSRRLPSLLWRRIPQDRSNRPLLPELPAAEPVPTQKPAPPAPQPVAQSATPARSETAPEPVSRMPDAASAAPAPSQIKPPKPHNPTRASVPAPPARTAPQAAGPVRRGPDDGPTERATADQRAVRRSGGGTDRRPSASCHCCHPANAAADQRGVPRRTHAWLERHKIYPAAARQRGEQGSAVLRFRVGRDGRILAYQLVRSTGYAALDAAVDEMMRGATLPPFPASMTQPEIAVSVPIRFSLSG